MAALRPTAIRPGAREHTGYEHVVFGPFEFFPGPERDSVTNPIGPRLRLFCAFHCPHLLPGQALRWLDREQATPQARTGVCCLMKYDAGQGNFVPGLGTSGNACGSDTIFRILDDATAHERGGGGDRWRARACGQTGSGRFRLSVPRRMISGR
jgi:hypothetical protein